MKAMIFAAGMGSRLKELTRDTPKCLMSLGKETILEHVVARLKAAGVSSIVINVHHLADQVVDFVKSKDNFGLTVNFSREAVLLDTGGGLKKVAAHFAQEEAFIIHNADVFCDTDLGALVKKHAAENSIATLAVMKRSSSRGLYLSRDRHLVGWTEAKGSPPADAEVFGFCGISVASRELFSYMEPGESFSIIKPFLTAAHATHRVLGEVLTDSAWVDIGTPEQLQTLRDRLAHS
jgi:NDP-sugar pyrophosphorylase family protein